MEAVAAAVPAHRVLREATRPAHDAAEASGGMRRLMRGDLSLHGYRTLLDAQWALFARWESDRADWLQHVGQAWAYRSRSARLRLDLEAGAPSVAEAPPAAPDVSDAHAWGELYVIEGSALGGRVIVRQLRALYPHMTHHYYGMGEDGPPWPSFQRALDAALPDAATQAQAIDGALSMFARFQRTLQDPA